MKCSHAERQFEEVYRNADNAETAAVADHIRHCDACTRLFRQWTAIARTLENGPAATPSAGLLDRIETAVEAARTMPIPRTAAIFRFPVRLAWAAVLALVVGGSIIITTMSRHDSVKSVAATQKTVTFTIDDPQALSVAIVGDFNGWDTKKNALTKKNGATWTIDLPLVPGSYQYSFLIDGKKWTVGTSAKTMVPDGFGMFNLEVTI